MSVALERLDPADPVDRADLIAFLTGNTFPFHVRPRPTVAQVETALADGAYRDDDHESLWLVHDRHGRIGLLRLEDLSDNAPLFDLRLAEQWRGKGLGREAVDAATDFVFTTMPEVSRFEAHTREDNVAMRRTLRHCGWVKEAHHRDAWPVEGSLPLASIAYAILRRDWQSGTTTPVPWQDEPA